MGFFDHPIFILIMFVIGIWSVTTSDGWLYYLGVFILVMAVINLIQYIHKKSKRPKCEYCGYIAKDDRELHNHQINCEKKKEKID